ncbi:MAG: toll/interleukin-1 receptor domain-containing protein, partial [Acidimicrobiia bacterium]
MAHDVFISYAAEDKTVADAACGVLERHNVRCWIAPRDVAPGADYAAAIVDAIREAKVLVLVFSSHANDSPHVRREVERAVSHGIAILPLRIEEVLPSPTLEYFISDSHWLDALTPPVEAHLENLAETTADLVERAGAPARSGAPAPARLRRRVPVGLAVAAALVLVIAVAVVVSLLLNRDDGNGEPSPQERIESCVDDHGLESAAVREDVAEGRFLFRGCSWPPPAGGENDGFTEIAVASTDGPGESEAEGLTVADTFTTSCDDIEVGYVFDNMGTFVTEDVRLTKGEVHRVEDGSIWTPRT